MGEYRAKGFAESLKVKDANEGLVTAVFSRFNVMDHDGDVTVPGAFPEGKEVPIGAYGHQSYMGELPVGKGIIRQTDSEAILDGQFFLETTAGRDTFEVVKNLGPLQEWSYGFSVESISFREFNGQEDVPHLEKLDPHEVSPVLKGAGIDTVTLDAKNKEALEDRLCKVLGEIDELKEGRALSASNRNRLEQIGGQLRSAADDLDGMLADTAPADQNDNSDEAEMKMVAIAAGIEYAETILERA